MAWLSTINYLVLLSLYHYPIHIHQQMSIISQLHINHQSLISTHQLTNQPPAAEAQAAAGPSGSCRGQLAVLTDPLPPAVPPAMVEPCPWVELQISHDFTVIFSGSWLIQSFVWWVATDGLRLPAICHAYWTLMNHGETSFMDYDYDIIGVMDGLTVDLIIDQVWLTTMDHRWWYDSN